MIKQLFARIKKFQSTLPRGERRIGSFIRCQSSTISIHAPARGATVNFYGVLQYSIFQSTLPRGERPFALAYVFTASNFNPRSREGSDDIIHNKRATHIISIHAPARGATPTYNAIADVIIFQSTLPRGERHHRLCSMPNSLLFQSTLPRGERQRLYHYSEYSIKFQSTLPRGERRIS